MKKIFTHPAIFIVIISFLPLLPLLVPGLPVTHDGQDHVARIANFYQSLTEGNIIPRWAGNLNWGYGHPILMFLYPLPSYVASLFHFIGFSFVDSTKLVFAVAYIASIFAMYLWSKSQWGERAGFAAALLYGFAPYRFVDLYVRGAIGEHVAFIFPPLILWATDRKRWLIGTLAVAGLLLSHNAVSLMFAPVIILYILYHRRSFLPIVLGLLISAFFWIPALYEGRYTLRDIVTNEDFAGRFVHFSQFFYTRGNELSKEIGIVGFLIIVSAIVLFFRRREKFLGGVLIVLGISIFLIDRGEAVPTVVFICFKSSNGVLPVYVTLCILHFLNTYMRSFSMADPDSPTSPAVRKSFVPLSVPSKSLYVCKAVLCIR